MSDQIVKHDNSLPGFLLILLPAAFAAVFLSIAWPFILGGVVLLTGNNVWQSYQWAKLSQQVNPYFSQMVLEQQGEIAPLALSARANISAPVADRYLQGKAAEIGGVSYRSDAGGTVYSFLTVNALENTFAGLRSNESATQKLDYVAEPVTSSQTLEKSVPVATPISAPETISVVSEAIASRPATHGSEVASDQTCPQVAPEVIDSPAIPAPTVVAEVVPETPVTPAEPVVAKADPETPVTPAEPVVAKADLVTPVILAEPVVTKADPVTPVIPAEPVVAKAVLETPVTPAEPEVTKTVSETPVISAEPVMAKAEIEPKVTKIAEENIGSSFAQALRGIFEAGNEPVVTEAIETIELAEAHSAVETISQADLAKRLDVHPSTLYKRRSDVSFGDWTRNRDPEGLAWGYQRDTKEFYRLT